MAEKHYIYGKNQLRCIYDEKIKKFILLPPYIYYYKRRYEIRKKINKKLVYWGRFKTIHDALIELNDLIYSNWDIESLVEV